MPIKQESLQTELRDLLKSKGYRVTNKNSSGDTVPVPEEADVFQFEFKKDGKSYGNVFATVDGLHQLVLYYNNEVASSPKASTENGESWEALVRDLKNFSRQRQLSFELSDQSNLESDMAKRTHMKKLDEGYYAMGKKASYSDAIPTVKMVIQHSRQIEEGEQRYRNIAKIFVENTDGERFLLPTTKPGLGRVYARHIAEGGTPYDTRGQHITSLVEEYSKMAGFVRATRNGQFNESAQRLVAEGVNHYQKLRESLHKLTSKRGYDTYFESYTPALMEDESSLDLSEMFMSSSLDPRIESVMPILSKLNKSINENSDLKQVSELAEWADKLTEFANNDGGNGGDDYLRTLASAWYNQDLSAIAHEVKKDKNPKKKGMMDRVIDAQVAVEKMLARGVVCGDGKVRKFSIDYNSGFDGVVMTYEDYAEYSDYGDDGEDIDSRTGKPWPNSKYDQIEFTDDQLYEGAQHHNVTEGHDPDNECYTCRGTGEGQHEGSTCSVCDGSGIEPMDYDDDDDMPAGGYESSIDEAKPDFAKKLQKNIDKSKIARVKTHKDIGTRVSDIDPWSGKESNVKTDKEWDKQKGVAEDTYNDDVKRAFPSGKAPGVKTGANAPKGTSTIPKDKAKAKGNPVAEGQQDLDAILRIIRK